jgi:hypothetical protein
VQADTLCEILTQINWGRNIHTKELQPRNASLENDDLAKFKGTVLNHQSHYKPVNHYPIKMISICNLKLNLCIGTIDLIRIYICDDRNRNPQSCLGCCLVLSEINPSLLLLFVIPTMFITHTHSIHKKDISSCLLPHHHYPQSDRRRAKLKKPYIIEKMIKNEIGAF